MGGAIWSEGVLGWCLRRIDGAFRNGAERWGRKFNVSEVYSTSGEATDQDARIARV